MYNDAIFVSIFYSTKKSCVCWSKWPRNALQESGGTVPNQIKKPTSKPTARWLLFLLKSVNIVKYKILDFKETMIEGLTDLKKYIACLFGETVKNIYFSYAEAT